MPTQIWRILAMVYWSLEFATPRFDAFKLKHSMCYYLLQLVSQITLLIDN